MWYLTSKTQFHKKVRPKSIINIYVSIVSKYLQFWYLVYISMLYPTWYVNLSNIIFNNNMIKIDNICVIITESLLHLINIRWCRKNSQHYMLGHPNFNNISIENYRWEIFPKFMSADGVYVILSLNWLYAEVISSIQC